MRRVTGKKVILHKVKEKAARRDIALANGMVGTASLYAQIKRMGGKAKVCIIRGVGGIGDVLMTTPAIRQLKREFPLLEVTYAVDRHRTSNDVYYELVKNAWFIDDVVDARYVQRAEYDVIVNLSAVCIRYERRGLPSINRIDLFAKACGVTNLRNKIPFYKVESVEALWAQKKLSPYKRSGKKLVALHTASFEGKRSWNQSNQYELLRLAAQEDENIHFLVFDFNRALGNLNHYNNCTDMSNTTVREMAALIEACDVFIGPDSGPMHIAGALGIKSLVLFGSIPPGARINHYPTHESVQATGLSCLGCWYEACPIAVRCMTSLSAATVFEQLKKRLGEKT